jgi:hypothetical protein
MLKLVLVFFLFFLSFILFSMKEEEKVVSVEMSSKCIKTLPCKHVISVTYESGKKVKDTLNSCVIAQKYWDFLSLDSQNHLLCNPNVYKSKINTL